MSLSVVERRELLAFAELVERAETPEVRLAIGSGLRLWVDAKTATRVAGDEQLSLLEEPAADLAAGPGTAAAAAAAGRAVAAERPSRPPSMTPNAIRKRAKRAEEKARIEHAAEPAAAAADGRGTRPALSERESLSPSNSKGEISRVRTREADRADPLDPDQPEPEDLEVAFRRRPDLAESVIRHSWFRFAAKHPWGSEEHWRNWVAREDASKTGLAPAPCTPPKSESRPIVRAELALAPCDVNDALLAAERAMGPPVRAPAVA